MTTPETVLLYADGGAGQAWLGERIELMRTARAGRGEAGGLRVREFRMPPAGDRAGGIAEATMLICG